MVIAPSAPASMTALQIPAEQLPALHDVPSAFFGLEHVPLAGSQAPTVWHSSLAVQTTGSVP